MAPIDSRASSTANESCGFPHAADGKRVTLGTDPVQGVPLMYRPAGRGRLWDMFIPFAHTPATQRELVRASLLIRPDRPATGHVSDRWSPR
jgi:hypothetical protein